MFLTRFRTVPIFVVAAAVTGFGFQSSPSNRQWPPGVQKVPDESPALSPADALKTFYMPPGYRLELVASEPMIQDPIVIDWDPAGRLWAVEMPGFVPNLSAPEPNMDPIGRVVVLEDANNDGKMDKRTVFADGLILPRALKVLDRGVLVGEPPYAWLMHDTNGDLRMDTKEQVTNIYGSREARVEQNANEFHWGLDNWMHTANGDQILRLKDGRFEVQKSLSRGEWGVTHDDAGRIYRNTNESSVHVDFVPTPYYMRNPNLMRTRGSYEPLRDPDNLVNVVWPARPTPGTNRAYQFGIRREDGSLNRFTAVCAPLVYRGDRLPAELYGNMFVAEPAANLVSRIIIEDDGTTLRARKAYERGEFLSSTDERFRPVYLSNGPDGTLYIVDMYRGVIQQRADITEYLRDHIVRHKLEGPNAHGRIYRVVHETTTRDPKRMLTPAPPAQLVETLAHPNGWWRDTAQRLLVERGVATVVPALTRLAEGSKDWRTRLHALWTLDGTDKLDPALVMKALADPSRDVRVSAIRLSERWLGEPGSPMQAAVLKRLDDADWAERKQLAASLGALPPGPRETAIAAVLARYADDPMAMDAALSGVRGAEATVLENLLSGGVRLKPDAPEARLKPDATGTPQAGQKTDLTDAGAQSPQREAAITMIAATLIRGGQDLTIQNVLASIADESRPAWQRSALLRGAEVAVLGETMPGSPPARRGGPPAAADAPCATCPGGRAGPGGAYAFPQAPRTVVRRRPLRLSREPAGLAAVAAGTGDMATRAATVLAGIEWPGKPGAAEPIRPLTADEQLQYNAGQEVYKNICQACHQPDGRGQERVAPTLLDSELALAAPEIPARILLNGKEGPVGLMPPVGSVLSDEQIAAVLTYIRREWGQPGTPVEAATVKEVRAATAGRTRPWTHDELTRMAGAGRGGQQP
jgi:mono/diheme cytochrome c family protein/glucose/arabinose dehydrogenase